MESPGERSLLPSEVAVPYQCHNKLTTGEMCYKNIYISKSLSLKTSLLGLSRLFPFINSQTFFTSITVFSAQQARGHQSKAICILPLIRSILHWKETIRQSHRTNSCLKKCPECWIWSGHQQREVNHIYSVWNTNSTAKCRTVSNVPAVISWFTQGTSIVF